MTWTLQAIADEVGGIVQGDGALVIARLAAVTEAEPGDLTYVSHKKYERLLRASRASAVLAAKPVEGYPGAHLLHPHPALAFARALHVLYPPERPAPGVSPHAIVEASATLGTDVSVGPWCYVGPRARVGDRVILLAGVYVGADVVIGADSLLRVRAVVRERCTLGQRVLLHEGVVIGSDGFGYIPDAGRLVKIPQVGTVRIDDDVEIGAHTTVDRATLGTTWIQRGTKIDNLVQIAHNVVVGEDSAFAAQVGIAGSTTLGHRVMLGGQVGISDHLTLGYGVNVGAHSGVGTDVDADQTVTGYPAVPHNEWLRTYAALRHLPEMRKQVHDLIKRFEALEKGLKG